jgi:hypothetical protein
MDAHSPDGILHDIAGRGSAVQGGSAEAQLTRKEVKALVAKTPGEHMKLVQYFNQKADRLEAESTEHEELAEQYRNDPTSQAIATKHPMSGRTAAHCEYFAKSTREAAKAARALAAAHEQMAKDVSK